MERKLVVRKGYEISDGDTLDDLIIEIKVFKDSYPNGRDFYIDKDWYGDDCATFKFTCTDLETDEEMEKRITLENNSIKCKEAKERDMYEQLKKKFEGEK